MATLHHFNILAHISLGTLALLVGLGPLLARKGGRTHRRLGGWFLGLTAGVVLTAGLGLAVFNFRPFLTVVVLLSAYQAFAGYRTARMRATGPTRLDGLVAAAFGLGGLAFLVALPHLRRGWSPVVLYSALGTLLATTAYDLSRPRWRARWQRGAAWRYEHIWKMMGAYSALLSAFAGTVLAAYQPYSQVLPSVLGTAVALGFMWRTYRPGRPAALPILAAGRPRLQPQPTP